MQQTTANILMIRPVNFTYNKETAINNAFQVTGMTLGVQENALKEFNDFVLVLQNEGLDITVVNDTPEPYTPDAIFPNNWISFHEDGTVVLYPMFALNRRQERKPAILKTLSEKFNIKEIIDFSGKEKDNRFLEGTGSMVLDRANRIAYAGLSPRTESGLFLEFCRVMQYEPVMFNAVDEQGNSIYHTNVMMCIADQYMIICLDSIPEKKERQNLLNAANKTGKVVIDIDFSQMNHFAGNMLQVNNKKGDRLLVMSSQAYGSLTHKQVEQLNSYNRIIYAPLSAIENNGGGSARCMMAEIYLPALE
ncbi:MAG: arginine deiminase-related protein [Flavitalea sp.]